MLNSHLDRCVKINFGRLLRHVQSSRVRWAVLVEHVGPQKRVDNLFLIIKLNLAVGESSLEHRNGEIVRSERK